jgi:ABC-type transporter Mla MlaB component
MLRITPVAKNGTLLLRLEGKLLAPWTAEVLSQLQNAKPASRIRLDLRQLSFVDDAGLALLRDLIARGAVIESASSFISELLHVEKP